MKEIEVKISKNEINYDEAVMFMESKVDNINKNLSKELLWFLSHNHIFTQGTSAKNEEVLNSSIIDVIKNKVKSLFSRVIAKASSFAKSSVNRLMKFLGAIPEVSFRRNIKF